MSMLMGLNADVKWRRLGTAFDTHRDSTARQVEASENGKRKEPSALPG